MPGSRFGVVAALVATCSLSFSMASAEPNAAIEHALNGTGAAASNSWETIRPLALNLANRPAAIVDVAPNELKPPLMRGSGGAASVYINLTGVARSRPYENFQANQAMEAWVRQRQGGSQSSDQLRAQFMGLLRGAESELRRRGLPIDSLGSALEFLLYSDYEVAVGPQTLTPSQERSLRGDIALQIAQVESSGKDGFVGAEEREQRYQDILVKTETIRDGYLASHGADRDEYRAQASKDLAQLGVDPAKLPLSRAECAIPTSKTCDDFLTDATPIFDRLADKFPY